MSRKLIVLNAALLVLAGVLVWQARRHYFEMKAHERQVLAQAVKPKPVLPPPVALPPASAPAMQYIDVAQRTLFAKDRNPNVAIETPPPPPQKPMPALPVYYGQMHIGDPVIFLAYGNGSQKRFQVGDKVGEFQLLAFDNEKIKLGWDGKEVEKKLDEIKPKTDSQAVAQTPAASPYAPQAQPQGSAGSVKSLSGPVSVDLSKPETVVGPDRGDGFRTCAMNDPSPNGAVVDGYQKRVVRGLMGNSCYWEKVK